jgi:hypothetical protein
VVKKTGFWVEKSTAPYFVLDDDYQQPCLIKVVNLLIKKQKPKMRKLRTPKDSIKDPIAIDLVSHSLKLSYKSEDYDAVFYPSGHGPF